MGVGPKYVPKNINGTYLSIKLIEKTVTRINLVLVIFVKDKKDKNQIAYQV